MLKLPLDPDHTSLRDLQAGRLIQVFYVVEASVCLTALLMFYQGHSLTALVPLIAAVCLPSVYFLARSGKVILGTNILLTLITLAVSVLM